VNSRIIFLDTFHSWILSCEILNLSQKKTGGAPNPATQTQKWRGFWSLWAVRGVGRVMRGGNKRVSCLHPVKSHGLLSPSMPPTIKTPHTHS
jgi:hypothetical protein